MKRGLKPATTGLGKRLSIHVVAGFSPRLPWPSFVLTCAVQPEENWFRITVIQNVNGQREHVMQNAKFQAAIWRSVGLGALALVVVLAFPGWMTAREAANAAVTFTKDVAPILQEK